MRYFACAALLLLSPVVALAQEKMLPTPTNITIEGVPAIPQSIAEGLARYAQFRQAQSLAWHPTRRQMVITTALGATPQLYMLDGPGRDRRQLTWYDRAVPPIVAFDPTDPNAFVFQFDPDGSELRPLYRYDLAAGQISLVTPSKTRYPHVWARQGKWLAFDSAERNGKDRDIYVMQPADPSTKRRLTEAEGAWAPQDWTPDGATLIVNEVFSNSETYLWRVEIKTGQMTAITPRDGEKAAWFNARVSADGKKLYALSDRQGGEFRIWRCDLARCTWTPVTAEGVRADSPVQTGQFEISPDGTTLGVIIDRGSSTELHLIDLTTLKARTVATPPGNGVAVTVASRVAGIGVHARLGEVVW